MTDARRPDPLGDEVLSAYLSGDLDDVTAAAVDAALARDPAVARRLDATARMLVTLRGVDEVVPPPGAGKRLRERLAAELDQAGAADLRPAEPRPAEPHAAEPHAAEPHAAEPHAAEPHAADPPPVTALDSRRRMPWQAVAGIAAGIAAFALVGGGVLGGFGSGLDGDDMAADAPDADMQLFSESEQSARERASDGGAGALEDAVEEAAPAPAMAAARPVVRDEAVVLDGSGDLADEVAARYRAVPEAEALLGEEVASVMERAAGARVALRASPPFRSGHHPEDCLDAVSDGADPSVPVLVESAVVAGGPAVVYVLVGATPDATTFDRVDVWFLTLPDCAAVLEPAG